uniref:Uncharacterized protein n=1 Tax=Fagus sylvatica TaxID=28930 RepID=A0A2N9FTJ5_FAGSY
MSLLDWIKGVILQYPHSFCGYGTHSIGTIKCDISTIICDVGTIQCDIEARYHIGTVELPWIKSCIGYNTEAELKVANVSVIGERLPGAWERSTSWESTIGEIKFNFFYLGGPHIAHRVWSDYAKIHPDLNHDKILSCVSFLLSIAARPSLWSSSLCCTIITVSAKAPKCVSCTMVLCRESRCVGKESWCQRIEFWNVNEEEYSQMDAFVYIVSAKTREQFLQPKKELHALLFDMEAFANVPFLIFCFKNPGISDIPEEEMVAPLDLTDFTTGRGRVQLADANIRPLEVFVAEEYNREQFLDGIEWLSHHITTN